jgi:hypothetical protein
MYLIDTNIWLELLLEQERSKERIFISEFSLYSIGVILFKLKKESVFDDFLEYLFKSEISIARLSLKDMKQLVLIKQKFNASGEKFNKSMRFFASLRMTNKVVFFPMFINQPFPVILRP